MTRLRHRAPTRAPRVDPSARDPIASWLDVFVNLLHLPNDQKRTIRDELEDHLRSRVDDLLITGISEPEATRRAVAELGETAELARSFRAAATQGHTRRLIMTASLCTALGAALVVGVGSLTGSPNLAGAPPAETAAHAATPDKTITLRGKTYGELFDHLKAQADRPVLIHWDRLEESGITADTPVGLDVDPLPAPRVHALLRERAEHEFHDPLAIIDSPELVEITTQSHADRRTKELRTIDLRDLLEWRATEATSPASTPALTQNLYRNNLGNAAHEITNTLMQLCAPDTWDAAGGDLSSAKMSGTTLYINAPKRVHDQVLAVVANMRDDADRASQQASAAAEQNMAEARQAAERQAANAQRMLTSAMSDLENAKRAYANLAARHERLELETSAMPASRDFDPDAWEERLIDFRMTQAERDIAEQRMRNLMTAVQVLESEARRAESELISTPPSGRAASATDAAVPLPAQRRLESIDRLEQEGRLDADRAAIMRQRAREQQDRATVAR